VFDIITDEVVNMAEDIMICSNDDEAVDTTNDEVVGSTDDKVVPVTDITGVKVAGGIQNYIMTTIAWLHSAHDNII